MFEEFCPTLGTKVRFDSQGVPRDVIHQEHFRSNSGYVTQGDFVLKIDGKPEQTLKAGDSYETSPQTPHDACSISGNKLIDTFVIEKGKPLASPAP